MSFARILLTAALAMTVATASLASEPVKLGWDDLAPEPVEYDNPFADLTRDQMSSLREILRFESTNQPASSTLTPDKVADLRAQLSEQGLDVDRLFAQRDIIMEQRRTQAVSVNSEVVGTAIKMPGYILPLQVEDRRVTEFLLVPTVGACIHTPPPPANQIVHVQYPEGFEIEGLYTPVWISGTLNNQFAVRDLFLVDGTAAVEVSYEMQAESVELY